MNRVGASAVFIIVSLWGTADADLLGPTSYLQFSDSPFYNVSFPGYFHLEDFEDGFNVPGVTSSVNGEILMSPASSFADSVDGDDGIVDGSGLDGASYFVRASGVIPGQVTFTFDSSSLGTLPTHAGVVWTDGVLTEGISNFVTFEAFDQNGTSMGTRTGMHIDGSVQGTTDEDRFYGATNPDGISRISIKMARNGIEIDHLQYGSTAIPEPPAYALLGVVLVLWTSSGVSRWLRRPSV